MDYSKKITFSESVFSQEIDGEVVLLDMNSENYYGLDSVGSDIWKLLREGKTLQETNDLLLEDYDVSQEQLRQDLEAFVDRLMDIGLIGWVD